MRIGDLKIGLGLIDGNYNYVIAINESEIYDGRKEAF